MKKTITSVPIIFLSTFLSFYLFTRLNAVPHINGKDPGPKEYVRKIPDIKKLQKAGLSPQAIAKTIGTTGTRKIAVILVNFSEAGTNTSGSPTMSSTDITGFNTTFDYLKNFYKEASYGKLDLDITFFHSTGSATSLGGNETPFTLTIPMSTYGADTDASLSQLVIDSLNACGQVSAAAYDGVIVAHAGYGNESTENAGDIWAAYVGPFTATYGFTEGTNVAAKEDGASNIGVACHEFGHHIGLWDLYSTGTSGGATQVGLWSLMDYGVWLGNPAGSKPSHPSGWEKEKLGWLNYAEISSGTSDLSSYSFEASSATVYKLKAPDTETEYFVVYHTSKTAYSPATAGNGLLIWHIDEGVIDGTSFAQRKADNSLNNYSHRTADVEEADYTDPSVTWGDSGDLWPGTRLNFTPGYSNKYNGQPSMVNVLNVSNYVQLSSFTVSYKPFIGGYVRDAAGKGIAETVLRLSANSISSETITDSNGYYTFTDLMDGAYTVVPLKTGYNFLPANKSVIISGYYSNNNNFTGIAAVTYSDLTGKPNNIKPVNNLFVPGGEKTTVYYKTAKDGRITIKLYTLDGRFVKTLLDENVAAGVGSVEWGGLNEDESVVSSGIYLVQITAPDYREIKKICVIR